MDLMITKDKGAIWQNHIFPCAVGPNGIGWKEREGDGITPLGFWPIRQVFYRADRIPKPETVFPVRELQKDDGWCDASEDPHYNQYVKLPYPASHEDLWREDHLYDVIVVLGHNDDPVIKGKGSAIFMHVARENFSPTQGCVALDLQDLLRILKEATLETRVVITNK